MGNLDSWITGNDGYDHPDNDQHPNAEESDRLHRARAEADARDDWQARKVAWQWVLDHSNGVDNVGLCPVCGERVQVVGTGVTTDGRLVGTCHDAFTVEQWEKED